jgi:hypothetical protein
MKESSREFALPAGPSAMAKAEVRDMPPELRPPPLEPLGPGPHKKEVDPNVHAIPVHHPSATVTKHAPPPPSAITGAVASPASAPASATSTPTPAPSPNATPTSSEPFSLGRAWVEIGIVTPDRVKEQAVRLAVRNLTLGRCYHAALLSKQSHAAGNSILQLSFDAEGKCSGALLLDAQFLPEMTACVQNGALTMNIGPDNVTSPSGGTAEVRLLFKNQ